MSRVLLRAAMICCIIVTSSAQSFSQAVIGQSTPLAGASNLLTVTIVSDTTLTAAANSAITLSGLGTASSGSGSTVTLLEASSGNSGHLLFGSQASWSAGSLTCALATGMTLSAGTTYKFSFILLNPAFAQSAQTIKIQASGSASIGQQSMISDAGTAVGVSGGRAPLRTIVAACHPC